MAQAQLATRRQKAALVLMSMGPELAAEVFKHMSELEVEALSVEVARLGRISHDERSSALVEFREMCTAQEFIAEGGVDHARAFLEAAFGPDKASAILDRVVQAMQVLPFDFVKKSDPAQLLSYIQEEHPQTIALILAHLPAAQAAPVLVGLPNDIRAEVARRIATTEHAPMEVIHEIENVLERKRSTAGSHSFASVGGVRALVDVLNCVDRQTEKLITEALSENYPELAEDVKKLLFVFEDITLLDDPSIQKVLREVDAKELALALKGVNDEVRARIFKNMSERAGGMLKEEMEFMGPVRLRTVEEAQQRIVGVIRRLEESGDVVVARGGNAEEIIV